jgi:hypothetical protein
MTTENPKGANTDGAAAVACTDLLCGVRVRLQSGKIVCLPNDCDCHTHTGPHWIHMDDMDRSLNKRLLSSETQEGLAAFLMEEQRRLKTKLRNMDKHGIAEILGAA